MDRKHRGAYSEHRAVAWLLERGEEVFRNVSAHGEVDIITRNPETGELKCYDVTTGTYYKKKNNETSVQFIKNKSKEGLDVIVVLPDRIFIETFKG